MSIKIELFPLTDASDGQYRQFNAFNNRLMAERLPDDPPIPLKDMLANIRTIPDFVDVRIWAAWESNGALAGMAGFEGLRTEENRHQVTISVSVLPEYRQQGIGWRLLAQVVEAAQADQRHLMFTQSFGAVPAGERFLERLGALRGLETHINQLTLANLDRSLLQRWQVPVAGFELGFWPGAYPESELQAVTALTELTNQQPMGALDVVDFHYSPDILRQAEQRLFGRGRQRWTYFVREQATGLYAGYTEIVWMPERPRVIDQDMTGVFPQFRTRGLGRWLKAAMLARILDEIPQAKFVRTGNADTNTAMLRINTELGFHPYLSSCVWQVETKQAAAYISTKGF